MDEINAEKAGKGRPDLIPAAAIDAVSRHWDYGDETATDEQCVLEAWRCLREFRQDGDVESLLDAAIEIASAGNYRAQNRLAAAVLQGGEVMGYGFRKHGNCTWRVAGTEQAQVETHTASCTRHVVEWLADPAAVEEGSGMPVLWHAFAQVMIAIDLVLDPPGTVDPYTSPAERF